MDRRTETRAAQLHPGVEFVYFGSVFLFSMWLTHPVSQLISLVGAFGSAWMLCGGRAVRFGLHCSLPVLLAAAVVNPLFQHRGVTVLAYFPSGNPLTLESVLYGISSGCMLAAILMWSLCLQTVMTADKWMYLFGKAVPSLSLLLSMTLRMIPLCRTRLERIRDAQKTLGEKKTKRSPFQRIAQASSVLSALVTWMLENAADTADSMKSRGYGSQGRSAFTVYRLCERDKILLAWLLFCTGYVLCGSLAGAFRWSYFPVLGGSSGIRYTWSFHAVHFLLCMMPVILQGKERYAWKQ